MATPIHISDLTSGPETVFDSENVSSPESEDLDPVGFSKLALKIYEELKKVASKCEGGVSDIQNLTKHVHETMDQWQRTHGEKKRAVQKVELLFEEKTALESSLENEREKTRLAKRTSEEYEFNLETEKDQLLEENKQMKQRIRDIERKELDWDDQITVLRSKHSDEIKRLQALIFRCQQKNQELINKLESRDDEPLKPLGKREETEEFPPTPVFKSLAEETKHVEPPRPVPEPKVLVDAWMQHSFESRSPLVPIFAFLATVWSVSSLFSVTFPPDITWSEIISGLSDITFDALPPV